MATLTISEPQSPAPLRHDEPRAHTVVIFLTLKVRLYMRIKFRPEVKSFVNRHVGDFEAVRIILLPTPTYVRSEAKLTSWTGGMC